MYLHTISPTGAYTSLDLTHMPVWRLELGVQAVKPKEDLSYIALMATYLVPGSPSGYSRLIIAAVDSQSVDDAQAIAAVGFQHTDLVANRTRLHEAARSLNNVEAIKKEAEGIASRIAILADLYHAILDALVAIPTEASGTLDAPLGAALKGKIDNWRFAITASRWESWRDGPDTFMASSASSSSLSISPNAPPAPGSMVQHGAGGNTPPPPIAPKKTTREQARATRPKAPSVNTPSANPPGMPPDDDTPPLTPPDVTNAPDEQGVA